MSTDKLKGNATLIDFSALLPPPKRKAGPHANILVGSGASARGRAHNAQQADQYPPHAASAVQEVLEQDKVIGEISDLAISDDVQSVSPPHLSDTSDDEQVAEFHLDRGGSEIVYEPETEAELADPPATEESKEKGSKSEEVDAVTRPKSLKERLRQV